MRASVEVYEDNAGGIYAAVFGQEGLKNVLSGFEYGEMSTSEFYDAAMYGFYDADEYNLSEHNGRTLDEEYTSLESCNLIAEFYSNRVVNLYPADMGCAGMKLFGLKDKKGDT